MSRTEPGPWESELHDFIRAFCGAFLFGVPLLFTMEMWWLGAFAETWKLLALLLIAFVANLGLAHVAGFKQETSFGSHVDQAVDAVAVGAVGSLIVLLVLNRIALGDPLGAVLGKVIVQIPPLSIGASIANAVFARGKDRQGTAGGQRQKSRLRATLTDIGATMIGGIFVGFSIAPTDEVPMLAARLTYAHQLALIAFSLVLTYAIVFESGFDPRQFHRQEQDIFQSPISETAAAYVVSLLIAFAALVLYNRAEVGDSPIYVLTQTLVLGVPTAIGGAAGRLVA